MHERFGLGERPGSNGNLTDLASAYDRWRGSTLGRITDDIERKLILDLIGDVAGRTILDVGCVAPSTLPHGP